VYGAGHMNSGTKRRHKKGGGEGGGEKERESY